MDLVSMKMSTSDANDSYDSVDQADPQAPKYPGGLQFSLDEESLKKLGIESLPKVGAKMMLAAEVEVCSVSQYESQDGNSDQRATLQITSMALNDGSAVKPSAEQMLYGQG